MTKAKRKTKTPLENVYVPKNGWENLDSSLYTRFDKIVNNTVIHYVSHEFSTKYKDTMNIAKIRVQNVLDAKYTNATTLIGNKEETERWINLYNRLDIYYDSKVYPQCRRAFINSVLYCCNTRMY